jgi:hypothetical protein
MLVGRMERMKRIVGEGGGAAVRIVWVVVL